jgi:hypothetical protein
MLCNLMANLPDEFYREQIVHLRALATNADPFIKKRLLDLAEKYDARIGKKSRPSLPLPSVTIKQPANDQHRGGNSG